MQKIERYAKGALEECSNVFGELTSPEKLKPVFGSDGVLRRIAMSSGLLYYLSCYSLGNSAVTHQPVRLLAKEVIMSRIFVSYSRADLEFVKKLVDDLAELGFDVLYDKRHFQGGRSTEPEIRAKIQQCDYFIPVMTGDAARSKWVRPVEVKLALKLQKDGRNIRILPLLLRKGRVEFRELSRLNYFDFTTDQPLAFAKLVQALPKVEYDELFNLQKVLDTEPFQDRTMFRLLRRMATREKRSGRLHDWAAMSAEGFMKEVRKVVHNAEDVDTAYWLLIIHGVLKFQDIENFWDESDNYKDSMKFAEVASRGVALMNELGMQQIQSRPRIRKSSARPRKMVSQ